MQGFKLKDIRDFHVLIVGNDRQLKDIKNVAECIQFAHSFTGSELKTIVGTGRVVGEAKTSERPVISGGNNGSFGTLNYPPSIKC
ncbi:hypothetical protein [Peribacillus frigoritolerans]|uniref:hypothetical protein n=1 Tax=Peribacillus frigoritolerans TaxID=450367 RepID=UPI003B8B4F48